MKVIDILEARQIADDRPKWLFDEKKVNEWLHKLKMQLRDEIWHLWMVERDYGDPSEDDLAFFVDNLFAGAPPPVQRLLDEIPHESLREKAEAAFQWVVEDFHTEAREDLHYNTEEDDVW